MVRDDLDLRRRGLELATAELLTALDAVVDRALNVSLETATKVLEHGRTTREHNVLNAEHTRVSHVCGGREDLLGGRRTLYKPRRVSIGQLWMAASVTAGSGIKKSLLQISGLKKISGPRKRS